jgi:hypothetical protein
VNFKRANATPDSTPLDSKSVLYKEKCSKENRKDQQTESLIGSIMYLREVLANQQARRQIPRWWEMKKGLQPLTPVGKDKKGCLQINS